MTDPSTTATKAELDERARELEIPGRSRMSADELAGAIAEAEARDATQTADPPVADEATVVPQEEPDEAPRSVRGSLLEVAQERAANPQHVRVIGAETPDQEA